MKKLYFRHGAMGSAKSLNAITVAHNYDIRGKSVRLYIAFAGKRDDTSKEKWHIESRMGIKMSCDPIFWDTDWDLEENNFSRFDCIIVDECQFLSRKAVDRLRFITIAYNVPVICYGLRTNWQSDLFEGSKRLMEVADSIEEVKTICYNCHRKAIMNKKIVPKGDLIDLPKDLYVPACYSCWE